jgi:AraC-like DNA-binding protein
MRYVRKKGEGDPSNQRQIFTHIDLKVLLCRYWSLSLWDCYDMIFPYWRIYWNRNEGGIINYNDQNFEMDPDYVYIIPPFTPFHTQYKKKHLYKKGINVYGHVIEDDDENDIEKDMLMHLFIHFNLGVPFDNVAPGVHKLKLNDDLKNKIQKITSGLKIENTNFSLKENLRIQSFILDVLSSLEKELWNTINIDDRVLKVLRIIEINMNEKFTNKSLADEVNMAPNSFARLFKNEMGVTLHGFIQKRKIAKACELFDHSSNTIEEVSYILGFSDRYHFSRVFKTITGVPPAKYKSGVILSL